MTKQEIFNKVWRHFVVEKHPRSAEGKKCFYRHPSGDGRRCAAGLFIKDDEYHESLESFGAHSPGVYLVLTKSGVPADGLVRQFLYDMQCVHDCSEGEFVNADRLREEAWLYGLEVPS
jgi:hypothetical protein